MSKNRAYVIFSNGEFQEVTESEFIEEMDLSSEDAQELTNKQDYTIDKKENEIMEEMNNKMSVKYEYKDIYKVKQQEEFSMSSDYIDGFSIYQVANFVLSVIRLTGYSVKSVLLQAIEDSVYVHEITDELNYLGYGSKEEE